MNELFILFPEVYVAISPESHSRVQCPTMYNTNESVSTFKQMK